MILVDTSVWVEVLKRRRRDEYHAAVAGEEVVTCLPIIQEVLQGIGDDAAFHIASAAFADIPVLENPLTRDVVDLAIRIFRSGRTSGVTVRSSVDCLIAACAIRNDATVLHIDRDFTNLSRVSTLRARRL